MFGFFGKKKDRFTCEGPIDSVSSLLNDPAISVHPNRHRVVCEIKKVLACLRNQDPVEAAEIMMVLYQFYSTESYNSEFSDAFWYCKQYCIQEKGWHP